MTKRWSRRAGALLLTLLCAMGGLAASAAESGDAVAKIRVSGPAGILYADGHSVLDFTISVLDSHGARVHAGTLSVATDGGILLDEAGHAAGSGLTAVPFHEGDAHFALVAPATPGKVRVRVRDGEVKAEGLLDFRPALRDMVAIGVVEAVISKHSLSAGSITPSNFSDGFEQEIRRWSHDLGGSTEVAGRTAFFLKGTIAGNTLLTAAFDSDKDTHTKLATTVDPNAVYPVYGDNSVVRFEAQSSERLYVRLDKDHCFLLYGDFSTAGPGASAGPVSLQSAQPVDAVLLGRYVRTVTGLNGHYEDAVSKVDSFVVDDTLAQVVEEYPANGTSGPFAIANNNAVQNSDRVEVIVRDKNQRGLIKSDTVLVRYVDYSFEPFSGRILLTQALPSLSPAGDPVSLRITYEVDQGGSRFFTYGAAASRQFGAQTRLGVTDVEDRNPLAPYRLTSANADFKPIDNLRIVVEAARTSATLYQANGLTYAQPSVMSGETGFDALGNAGRFDLNYKTPAFEARLWWERADAAFYNPAAGIAAGREEAGARGAVPVSTQVKLYAETLRSADAITSTSRDSSRLGVTDQVTRTFSLDFSVRHIHDDSAFPAEAVIGTNAAAPGAAGSVSGGFFGTGTIGTVVDPLTGAPINTLAPVGAANTPAAGHTLEANTVRVGAGWQATEKAHLDAAYERSLDGENHTSAEAGASYSLDERQKAYVRAETQTGLASSASLVPADKSTSFIAGVTRGISDETSVFSEYRLMDAFSESNPSTFDRMLANGLRNTQTLHDGLSATSTAESLRIFNGSGRDAVALSTRLNYTAPVNWKSAAQFEFRRLSDDVTLPGDQSQDQWMSTLTLARKLDADWTLLVKNYFLLQVNHDDASGSPIGNTRQERLLAGFAWRPTANEKINSLARYEYKSIDDQSQPLGEHYNAQIAAVTMDYHPLRPLWLGSRLAFKRETDFTLPVPDQTYSAWLLGGRVTVDMTARIDLGLMASTLRQQGATAVQNALGFETGYRIATNIWVSIGYNWLGFTERDLAASDYTMQGPFLRLRTKFDETLLGH